MYVTDVRDETHKVNVIASSTHNPTLSCIHHTWNPVDGPQDDDCRVKPNSLEDSFSKQWVVIKFVVVADQEYLGDSIWGGGA